MSEVDPTSAIPLTDAELHIMLVLANGENHGYAIMKAIDNNPHTSYQLGPATLYRTIRRLLESGIIEESDDRPDPEHDDERRRYYRLTGAGRQVLAADAERLAKLVAIARASGVPVPAPAESV